MSKKILLMMLRDEKVTPISQLKKLGYDAKYYRLRIEGIKSIITTFSSLLSLIKQKQIDIVHTDCRVFPFYLDSKILKLTNKPVVFTARQVMQNQLQDLVINYPFPIDRLLSKFYLKASDSIMSDSSHIICVSKWLKEEYLKLGIEKDKISHIYLGVSHSYKPIPEIQKRKNKDEIVITQISDLVFWNKCRGLLDLLEIFQDLKDDFNIKLWIVGDGKYKSKILDYANKEKILDRVNFLGHRNDILNILNLSDIYAHFSYMDALPSTILEAGACGLPTVATSCQGIPEAVSDGVTGYLSKPTRDDFKEKLIKLLENDNKRKKMGEKGTQLVRKNFSWRENAKKTAEIYEDLLSRK